MTRSTIFLGIAFVFGLLLTSGIGYAFDWATEAEMAATIEAPMVVGTSSEAADQGGPEPSAPSRGNFIWMPGPPVAGGAEKVGRNSRLTFPRRERMRCGAKSPPGMETAIPSGSPGNPQTPMKMHKKPKIRNFVGALRKETIGTGTKLING